jgi:hypothetical protein
MEQKWADPGALGNLTIGLLIFAQAFLMFGVVDPLTRIALIPWVLTAFPVLLIVVVIQFRNGDFVMGTCNGLLGVVLMGQNFVKGIIDLCFVLADKTAPQGMIMGGFTVDAMSFTVGGLILLFVGFLAGFQSKWAALSVWAAGLGFIFIGLANFGLSQIFGLLGVIGLMIIALWLVYSGLAMLVNIAMQKEVLPMGKPMITPPNL